MDATTPALFGKRSFESAVRQSEFDAFERKHPDFAKRVVTTLEGDFPRVVDRFAAHQAKRSTIPQRQQDPGDVGVDLRKESRGFFGDPFPCEDFRFLPQFEFVFGKVFFACFFAFFFELSFVFSEVFFCRFFAFFF